MKSSCLGLSVYDKKKIKEKFPEGGYFGEERWECDWTEARRASKELIYFTE